MYSYDVCVFSTVLLCQQQAQWWETDLGANNFKYENVIQDSFIKGFTASIVSVVG